jgi:ABC transporter DrrB family efflux protein
MSIDTLDPALEPGVAPASTHESRNTSWFRNVMSLTRRNLVHVRREPAQLSDAVVQPFLFTILFVYIFGSAMVLPGGGSYTDFAVAGLVVMNLTTATMGTAVGLSSDLSTGVMSRFRTLPMTRSTILVGRTLADLLASVLCGTIVLLTGLLIGWRADHGLLGVLAGMGIALAFSYAVSWFTACIGLLVNDPESSQSVGLIVLFPLVFLSTCLVPAQGLPTVLRAIAEWNPISAVAGALRELFGNPNPAALSNTFAATHPIELAIVWTVLILAVCAPLASWLLRRRTVD